LEKALEHRLHASLEVDRIYSELEFIAEILQNKPKRDSPTFHDNIATFVKILMTALREMDCIHKELGVDLLFEKDMVKVEHVSSNSEVRQMFKF
jgi:hypothetical protein